MKIYLANELRSMTPVVRIHDYNQAVATRDGLLLWALYHHQGGKSEIGQPIRRLLGLEQHDALTEKQIELARTAANCAEYWQEVLDKSPEAESILQQLDNLAWVLAEGVLILKGQNPEAADWFAEAEAALNALPLPPPDPAVAAIQFALEDDDGIEFLRCWNEGDFDSIRDQWPEAPEEVFIGADPLYCKKADGQEIN